jgi:predicted dehydrogenase
MKVLIVGLGSIGKKHVKAIKAIAPASEIFALRSRQNAEKYLDVTNIYNINEIVLSVYDFVIIANPTAKHKKIIAQMVPYGFPMFIEKPVHSSLDIKDEINAIDENGNLTYVACNLRFLSCIQFVKDKLTSTQIRKINEVNVYCGSYLPDWRPDINFRETYSANAELGGGVHIDLIHELDYIYWLFGMPGDVTRVFKNQSSLAITSFDYANYTLAYDGFCASVVLNYYRRDAKRSLELVFEDEIWNVNLLTNQISSNNEIIYSSNQQIADTYYEQMNYFINCIKWKKNTFNTIADAYNVLEICLGT